MGSGTNMMVQKRMSFLSSLVWGLSSIVIAAILCSGGLAAYTLNIADRKSDNLVEFVHNLIGEVPELVEALPPIFRDVFSDRRAPEYLDRLSIAVTVTPDHRSDNYQRPVLTVRNNGNETVSLLTIRVVVRDQDGNILDEDLTHVATPIGLERDFPGPILPGSTRRISAGSFRRTEGAIAEYEVTDVRVWVEAEDVARDS